MNITTLYRKHATGLGDWQIFAVDSTIYISHATVLGGSRVEHTEHVVLNQSGRSMSEQIALQINSRISRMKDRGYKSTIEEAMASSDTNQLGFLRPMLAQPLAKVKNINYKNAVLQKKLDGHRCMATSGDGVYAYSRQGKLIPSISHILPSLKNRLPYGETIDGELYAHGVPLQTIGSWIKREQPNTYKLTYVLYDIVSTESYTERHRELTSIMSGIECPNIVVLGYTPYTTLEDQITLMHQVRAAKFEGLMLKQDGYGYEVGKRSHSIAKIKDWMDAEFRVIGFEKSSEGWAVCVCLAPNGRTFGVAAPGTKPEKFEVWDNQHHYLNRELTIEFAYYTDDGIPFQPVAKCWYEPV